MVNNSAVKKTFGIIGTVFFFLTYIPFLYLLLIANSGFTTGLVGGSYVYGFEAVIEAFVWFCIIPVYPVCILYELIFGIAYIRKHKGLKIAAVAVVSLLAVSIFALCFYFELNKRNKISSAEEYVAEFLADKYGEDLASDITVSVLDLDEDVYRVTTHVLPESARFTVYVEDGTDDLAQTFMQYNTSFAEDLEFYLDEAYGLSDNMHLQIRVDYIDFEDYRDGDDYSVLYDRTDYRVAGIEVDSRTFHPDTAVDTVAGIMHDLYPLFEDRMSSDSFWSVYLLDNGAYAYSVTVYFDPVTAVFNRYSDYTLFTDLDGLRVDLE